jgi:hypothetical protein
MPCFYRVRIEIEHKEAAKEALEEMGLDPDRHLKQKGDQWQVEGIPSRKEAEFKTTYAETYAKQKARKNYYTLDEREEDGDTVSLKFSR